MGVLFLLVYNVYIWDARTFLHSARACRSVGKRGRGSLERRARSPPTGWEKSSSTQDAEPVCVHHGPRTANFTVQARLSEGVWQGRKGEGRETERQATPNFTPLCKRAVFSASLLSSRVLFCLVLVSLYPFWFEIRGFSRESGDSSRLDVFSLVDFFGSLSFFSCRSHVFWSVFFF